MTMRNVGFRLKTDGKAEVKNDFAEVRAAGASAMAGVADAAEEASERSTRAVDAFTARQIEAFRRQANAAKFAAAAANDRSAIDAALAQAGNGSQFATVNLDRSTGAARASADVFRPLIEAEEQLEARTRALITAIDPAWAAQQRFNTAMTEARELLELGRISTDQFAAAQTRAQGQLDVATGATKRAEVAAAALATMQKRVDAAGDNGFGGWAGSAERSAGAFRQLIAEQEQLERRTAALRAAIDPATAAQQRFDSEMAEARSLISQNAISLDEYVAKLRIEQAALNGAIATKGRLTNANRQAHQSGVMLGQQAQDFIVQVNSGQSVTTAFVQQIGQAAFALQGMGDAGEGAGGKLAKMAGFLTSWQGIVATLIVVAAAPFVAKLLEGNDALDDAVDKLKKDADASDISRRAKLRYAETAEGVAEAIRDGTDATRKSIAAQKDSAEQDNINAKRALEREIAIRKVTLALLDQARAEADQANSTNFGAAGGAGAAAAQGIYRNRVADLAKMAADQVDLIAQAEARVQQTRIALATEAATRAVDPMARIKKTYDDQVVAAQAKARAEGLVTSELTKQLAQIERNRQAAIKTEQERQSAARSSPINQFGREVSSAEASAIARAAGLQVNSADRSTASQQRLYDAWVAAGRPKDNPVARPGTSAHERGNALDIQMSAGATVQKIRDAFAAEGVKLTKVFAERGHWHVEWQRTAAMRQDDSDATKAAREAAAAERELAQDLAATVKTYDPARAAADEYKASLAKIQTLVGAGKLSLEDALRYAGTARTQYLTGQNERFSEQFKSIFGAGDPLKDLIEEHDRDQARRVGEESDAAAARVKVATAAMDELRAVGTQLVDDVLDPGRWDSWGDAGKGVLGMLKSEFIKLALLNPLKNMLSGNSDLPTLSSTIGSIGKLFGGGGLSGGVGKPGLIPVSTQYPILSAPRIGGNATGTEHWSGGMTYVNENGAELMDLPNGTRIYPAAETRRMLAAANDAAPARGGDVHNHFTGNLLTPEWWAEIQAGNDTAAARGAAGGAALGRADGMARGARRLGRAR